MGFRWLERTDVLSIRPARFSSSLELCTELQEAEGHLLDPFSYSVRGKFTIPEKREFLLYLRDRINGDAILGR
jgi:hypothetical protein